MSSRFDELLAAGRALTPEERAENIRSMALDPRFAALLADVRHDWEEYARAIGSQKLAPHHGCLEHCSGSLYALQLLEERLRGHVEHSGKPGKRRRPAKQAS